MQTAALKNQNFRNMSTAQINAFVRNCVDVSVDPAIIAAVESSLTTKGFSIIPEMNRDAPLTAAVKGYMEEVERLETANDSDAVFKSKMQKAYLPVSYTHLPVRLSRSSRNLLLQMLKQQHGLVGKQKYMLSYSGKLCLQQVLPAVHMLRFVIWFFMK